MHIVYHAKQRWPFWGQDQGIMHDRCKAIAVSVLYKLIRRWDDVLTLRG